MKSYLILSGLGQRLLYKWCGTFSSCNVEKMSVVLSLYLWLCEAGGFLSSINLRGIESYRKPYLRNYWPRISLIHWQYLDVHFWRFLKQHNQTQYKTVEERGILYLRAACLSATFIFMSSDIIFVDCYSIFLFLFFFFFRCKELILEEV